MAIEYVGGVASGRAGNTATQVQSLVGTLTGGLATSPSPGDLIVVHCSIATGSGYDAASLPIRTNGGLYTYTSLGELSITTVANYTRSNLAWKFADVTTETLNGVTIPSSGNARNAQRWEIHVFRGIPTSFTPTQVSATGTATGRPNPPSVTPTVAGSWILAAYAASAGTGVAFTAPTDFATNWRGGTTVDTYDAMAGFGYYTGWTSGAYDPAAITAGGTTGATDSWAAHTVVLVGPVVHTASHDATATAGHASVAGTPQAADRAETATPTDESAYTTGKLVNAYGYCFGGITGASGYSYSASVNRFAYANKTVDELRNILVVARYHAAAVSSGVKGYCFGGINSSGTRQTEIDGLSFASNTGINPSAVLGTGLAYLDPVMSASRGYLCGGYYGSNSAGNMYFAFATEIYGTVSANLTAATSGDAVFSTTDVGYVMAVSAGTNNKLTFATEAVSSFSDALGDTWSPGSSNSGANGYSHKNNFSALRRLVFTTDTSTQLASTLTTLAAASFGLSGPNNGYALGGQYNSLTLRYKSIDELSYTAETFSSISATLPVETFEAPNAGVSGILAPEVGCYEFPLALDSADGTAASLVSHMATFPVKDRMDLWGRAKSYLAPGYYIPNNSEVYLCHGITHDTDTWHVTLARYKQLSDAAGTYSATAGYWSCSYSTQYTSDKITFFTEAITAVSGTLSTGHYYPAGASSSTKGYINGMYYSGANSPVSTITFATEAYASFGTGLTQWHQRGAVHSATKGYFCGGIETTTPRSGVSAVTFSTDTVAATASLPTAIGDFAGASYSTAGYLAGGKIVSTPYAIKEVTKILFSTDATSTLAAAITVIATGVGAAHSATKGYFFGGSYSVAYLDLGVFTFSTETISNQSGAVGAFSGRTYSSVYFAGLTGTFREVNESGTATDAPTGLVPISNAARTEPSTATEAASAQGGKEAASHIAAVTATADQSATRAANAMGEGAVIGGAGGTGTMINAIDIFSFYAETCGTAGTTTGSTTAGGVNANTAGGGFYVGGAWSVLGAQDDVMSWEVATYSFAATANNLATARERLTSAQYDTKAFFAGGLNAAATVVSEIDAISLPSGTASNPSAALSTARQSVTGVSSVDYGYFAGGKTSTPTVVTTIDRLAFSGESVSTITETLDAGREQQGRAYSTTNGYMFTGDNGTSSFYDIDKLTYSNETMSDVTSSLTIARTYPTSLQSSTKGYIIGGWDNVTSATDDIESFTFSNESVGNPTSVISSGLAASGGISQLVASGDNAITESGSATATHSAAGSQSISQTDSGTATAAHDAIAAYLLSITEAGSATDMPSAAFNYAVAFLADTTADHIKSAVLTIVNAQTEPATAVDTKTVVAAFVSAQTETGAPVDTKTVAAAFVSANTETGTAADVPSSIYTTASSATEAGVPVDTKSAVQAQPVSSTETGTANDDKTVQAAFVSAKAEPATATDAPAGTYTTASTQTETGAATEAQDTAGAAVASRDEPTSADATTSAQAAFVSAQAESITAADTGAAQAAFVSAATETATALDVQNFSYLATATITEAGSAGSSEIGIYTAVITHAEPATANDLHDGSTVAGGTTHSVAGEAPTTAGETESVTFVAVAAGSEAATGTDVPTVTGVLGMSATEAATGADAPDAARATDRSQDETGTAADASNYLSANLGTMVEAATALDAGYATYITAVSITNPATALAEQAYDAIKYAMQDEAAAALDASDNTMLFFVSGDETAAAFDLSAIISAFVVSFDAPATAQDSPSATADFITSITEAAAAVSAATRWLAGSEFAKTTAVFVATTSEGRVVCYLKPAPAAVASAAKPTAFAETSEQRAVVELRGVASFVTKDPEA